MLPRDIACQLPETYFFLMQTTTNKLVMQISDSLRLKRNTQNAIATARKASVFGTCVACGCLASHNWLGQQCGNSISSEKWSKLRGSPYKCERVIKQLLTRSLETVIHQLPTKHLVCYYERNTTWYARHPRAHRFCTNCIHINTAFPDALPQITLFSNAIPNWTKTINNLP